MGYNEASSYNDQGIEEYNRKNYRKAEELYNKAISEDPAYKWALYNLGLVYQALNENEKAIEAYKKAIDIDPVYADAFNGIGSCYYDMINYKQAAYYYEKAMECDPKLKYPYYNLGLIAEKEKRMNDAKKFYEKALEIDPTYGRVYNGLGIIYYNEENYDKAMENYKKAIETTPTLVYPYYNIALIYDRKGDVENTKLWYKKALKVDPKYEPAMKGLEALGENPANISTESVNTEENISEDILERYGRNLNKMAKEGKLFEPIEREKEIQSVLEILYKRIKNNPILIGHPGVGKTAVVEGLAKRIVENKVPEFFKDKEVIELSIGNLIAGTTYRGQMEQKVKDIINEVVKRKNVIVFLDEVHTLVGAGSTSGSNMDIAQMLKPVLARGEFPCIGATTFEEYRKYFEKDAALSRRFFPVRIDELSKEGTLKVLEYLTDKMEAHYHLTVSRESLEKKVDITDKYIKKRYFPDKAIDILEKTASRCALSGKKEITDKDIFEIVGETCGTVFLETDKNENRRLVEMEDFLKAQIMGQDDAIERVSSLVRMTKRRLDLRPERPDGVFLFTGPSGVGKTELAKQLALFLYGSAKKMIKIDMTEFAEAHTVSKMIGSPPGYIGHDDEPFLTQKIEENPSSVLILDEIEKAHPDVMKIFLQVFDEGKLKDSKGKTVVFSDVIIIMTSNIITELKKKTTSLGFNSNVEREESVDMIEELTHFFPMEFLNRVDEIILFNHLGIDRVQEIIEKKIIKDCQKTFYEKGFDLKFDGEVIKEIMDKGYSRNFGARNLDRTFEKLVLRPLSDYIFKKEMNSGKIKVQMSDGKIEFQS